jgi:hypothetical protein
MPGRVLDEGVVPHDRSEGVALEFPLAASRGCLIGLNFMAPATTWAEAAAEARYLILHFAETSEARNPRRKELIAQVLDDLARYPTEPRGGSSALTPSNTTGVGLLVS